MVTGRLAVPELDIHTIYDQLVPVEQENWYHERVTRAAALNAAATRTGLGAFDPYVPFRPPPLVNART